MTDAQKKMRELSANLKPVAGLEIPTRLSQPHAQEPAAVVLPWDEEDEQLLAASMRDMKGTADSL